MEVVTAILHGPCLEGRHLTGSTPDRVRKHPTGNGCPRRLARVKSRLLADAAATSPRWQSRPLPLATEVSHVNAAGVSQGIDHRTVVTGDRDRCAPAGARRNRPRLSAKDLGPVDCGGSARRAGPYRRLRGGTADGQSASDVGRRRDASSSSAPAVSDITTAFAPERQPLDIRQASTTALPARAVVSARAKSWRRPLSFSAARPSSVGAEQERRRIVGVDHEPLVDATVAFAICAGGRRIRASLPGGVACRGM